MPLDVEARKANRVARRLGRVRIVFGLAGLLAPLFAPTFAQYRWLCAVYLALAMWVQLDLRRKKPSHPLRPVFNGTVDVLVLLFAFHRLGLLAPPMLALYFMVMVLYAVGLGVRRGLAVAVLACVAFDVVLALEAVGVVAYAPDALTVWRPGDAPSISAAVWIGTLFPVLSIGSVHMVGRVVDGLRREQRKNRELCERPVFGHYQLQRLIGQGGMGQVWEAADRRDGARVALKILSPGAEASPEARQRLTREARATIAIDHPNVARIREVFELADGTPVMVMDLLVGENLADRLARLGRLSVADTARIAASVVSAVLRAHELGIVHRDLKPENVFLQRVGDGERVVVLDFGIAKVLGEDDGRDVKLTRTGIILGSPAYMPPEQAFGERNLDHRVDVWALGIVLYECLCGVRPFHGDNVGQVLRAVAGAEIVPLGELCPDLPADVASLVASMLVRSREGRLSDLREVSEVLTRHVGDARSHSQPPRRTDPEALTMPADEPRAATFRLAPLGS
jgi:serine/threonine-protein kinase